MSDRQSPPYYPNLPAGQAATPSAPQQPMHADTPGIYPYLHVLKKRFWLIALCLCFGIGGALWLNVRQVPLYQSSTQLVVEPRSTSDDEGPNVATSLMRDPTFLMTQSHFIKSAEFAENVLKAMKEKVTKQDLYKGFDLQQTSASANEGYSEAEDATFVGGIRRSYRLRQLAKGARIIVLSVNSHDPLVAATLANSGSETYIQMNHESHIKQFKDKFSMISSSLGDIREKIKSGELAVQKIESEIKLLDALKIYGEKHPQVVTLRDEITNLALNLSRGAGGLKQLEIGQNAELLPLIMNAHMDLQSLAPIEKDLSNLKSILEREISTNRNIYDSIYQKLQEVEISGGSTQWVDIKLMEKSGIPRTPIRPNKRMNIILGVLVGIILGIAFAFFLEYLDSSLRGLEEVQNYLHIFPLGMVPEVEFSADEYRDVKERVQRGESSRIIWNTVDLKIPLYIAEAYRIIRTNFMHRSVEQNLKVFQVTSAVKGEGKTTTTANIGISLAQMGLKVLLVDGDMRRPSLHRVLRLPTSDIGLHQLLLNKEHIDSVIQQTKIDNLFCVPSGGVPENPSELLSSRAMSQVVASLGVRFDIVLIDSPPVISVADAPIISSKVDGTVLVARAGYIPKHLCLQAKKAIEAVNGKMAGCILNSVSSRHHSYYYSGYYKGYYNYYGADQKKKKRVKNKDMSLSPMERLKLSMYTLLPQRFQNREKFLDQFEALDLKEEQKQTTDTRS